MEQEMISRRPRLAPAPPPARPRPSSLGQLPGEEASFPVWPVMVAWTSAVGTAAIIWWAFWGPGRRHTYIDGAP